MSTTDFAEDARTFLVRYAGFATPAACEALEVLLRKAYDAGAVRLRELEEAAAATLAESIAQYAPGATVPRHPRTGDAFIALDVHQDAPDPDPAGHRPAPPPAVFTFRTASGATAEGTWFAGVWRWQVLGEPPSARRRQPVAAT